MEGLFKQSGFRVGSWRWPLTAVLPVIVGALVLLSGAGRLHYESRTVLGFSGSVGDLDQDLLMFQSGLLRKRIDTILSRPSVHLSYDKVSGHPMEISIRGEGPWPEQVTQMISVAGQTCLDQSLIKRKSQLHKEYEALQLQKAESESRFTSFVQERKAYFSTHPRRSPRAAVASKLANLDRQVNEAKLRLDDLSQRAGDAAQKEKNLKTAWTILQPVPQPRWPLHVDGGRLVSGVMLGVFVLGCVFFKGEFQPREGSAANGLWKPETSEKPIELEVLPAESSSQEVLEVPSDLPADPLASKAAELYIKWMEVSKVLYAPAPQPPQGVIESVGPLLQECIDFLPAGHDVLARYLAQTVVPGDLPAHVARTVLMTLIGAQDAGVTPEHCLAMALAALFHDLAVVPRPPAVQEAVGSDVGRLSASIIQRIPGLDPAVLSMVEDILIGMDEFKLETWQNAAHGKNLEPLSKVLREIDRFEKVMQKQKSRLDRQLAVRKAI
jgi:hypothetical protein